MLEVDRELFKRYLNCTVQLLPYHSGGISHAGYDATEKVFFARMHQNNEKLFAFFDVEPEVWLGFQQAEIKFRYFHTYINGLYPAIIAPVMQGFLGKLVPPPGDPPSQS